MASTLAMGPVVTAVLAALRASVALTTYVGLRVYPDANGDAPSTPAYPYVQVESIAELPWNTMGPASAAKWGSTTRFQVRIGSQSRSDAQANAIASIVKQALDGQPLTVSGYPYATVEYADIATLRDLVGGQTIREWVVSFEAWVHQ